MSHAFPWLTLCGLALLVFPCQNAPGQDKSRLKQVASDGLGDPLPQGAMARLGTVRFRAGPNLSVIAVSADGKRVATGSFEHGRITLFDLATGRRLAVLKHPDLVTTVALAFSPEGKRMVSVSRTPRFFGGGAEKLCLWDLQNNTALDQQVLDFSSYYSLLFSRDGKSLKVSANLDLSGWELTKNRTALTSVELKDDPYPDEAVQDFKKFSVIVSHDLRFAAGLGPEFLLWDLGKGRRLPTPMYFGGWPFAVAFAPDRPLMAVSVSFGDSQETLEVWNLAANKKVFSKDWGQESLAMEVRGGGGGSYQPQPMAFSGDGKILVGAHQEVLWRLDVEKKEFRKDPLGHLGPVKELRFSQDGRALTSVSLDSICDWDVAGRLVAQTPVPAWATKEELRHPLLAVSLPHKKYVERAKDGRLLLKDLRDQKTLQTWGVKEGHYDRVMFAPDGSGATFVWKSRDEWELHCFRGESALPFQILKNTQGGFPRWSPGMNSLLFFDQGDFKVVDSSSGKMVQRLEKAVPADGRSFGATLFSPDGRYFLFGPLFGNGNRMPPEWSRVVQMWDMKTGKRLVKHQQENWDIPLAVSPNVPWVAFGCDKGDISLVDFPAGKELVRFKGHLDQATCGAFSADGQQLATGSKDTSVLLWDLRPILKKHNKGN